ncbi:hypothetical protein KAR91_33820 [Candidatus Pacearchaeota archaeon]|nr:hypothetical protein [Candidatus Pacearchaeota archaeon]
MNSAIIFVGAILLFLGFSFPLTENLIPSKYTEDILTEKLLQVSTQINNKNENIEYLLKNEPDLHIIYGKALYPRLFEAGSRMEDDRYGDIPDFSSKRVEFFLVGTDNIWVTLPVNKKTEYFAHGSEVIVLGTREPEIFNKEGQAISSSYIKGECFILITEKQTNEPMILNCLGESGDY